MLVAYQQQVQRLLKDENAQFFSLTDLTVYINNARNDLARNTECLITTGTLITTAGMQAYGVSVLSPASGLLFPINIRSIRAISGNISTLLEGRSWQWFTNYYLNGNTSATTGTPTVWGMQNQGSSGTFYFWPVPTGNITLQIEGSWYPIPLVNDNTVEAIPTPWTDAVPYFAAYQAYLEAQRLEDAQRMLGTYLEFVKASRLGVTPNWMPTNFPTLKPLQSAMDTTLNQSGGGKPASTGEGSVG